MKSVNRKHENESFCKEYAFVKYFIAIIAIFALIGSTFLVKINPLDLDRKIGLLHQEIKDWISPANSSYSSPYNDSSYSFDGDQKPVFDKLVQENEDEDASVVAEDEETFPVDIVKDFMLDVDWNNSVSCTAFKRRSDEFEYLRGKNVTLTKLRSKWIDSCFAIISRSTQEFTIKFVDINGGIFSVTKNNSEAQTEAFVQNDKLACPLFRVFTEHHPILEEIDFNLNGKYSKVLPSKYDLKNISIVSTANGFQFLFSPWQALWNKAKYCEKMNVSHFLHLGQPYTSMLNMHHPYWLKTITPYLSLRHTFFSLVLDIDLIFTSQAYYSNVSIESFIPEFMISPDPFSEDYEKLLKEKERTTEMVFGSWVGPWFNSGVLLFRRSDWIQKFLCDYRNTGVKSLKYFNDQVGLFHVLLSKFSAEHYLLPKSPGAFSYHNDIKVRRKAYTWTKIILQDYLVKYFGHEPYRNTKIQKTAHANHPIPGGYYGRMYLHPWQLSEISKLKSRKEFPEMLADSNNLDLVFHCARDCPENTGFIKHFGHRTAKRRAAFIPLFDD
jgi:hypothetical protein